jgi:hypothetical protein
MWKGGGGEDTEGGGMEDPVSEPESEEAENVTAQPLESKSGFLDDLHKELCRKVSMLSNSLFLLINPFRW